VFQVPFVDEARLVHPTEPAPTPRGAVSI
jgi:hypothetical protein